MVTALERRRGRRAIAVATALTLAGVVGWFVVVTQWGAWYPGVRNQPIAFVALAVLGAVIALMAARRGRLGVRLLAGANVVLAGAFAWLLFGGMRVPAVAGPPLGSTVPAVTVTANDGRPFDVASAGDPLLLVFYRGHW